MKHVFFAVMMALAPNTLFADENLSSNSVWMIVVHDVKDYPAWRDVFDSGLSIRKSAGELDFEINRNSDDPNRIIAIFQWDTAERAHAFVNDPAIRNAMKAAGVKSDPIVTVQEVMPQFDGG